MIIKLHFVFDVVYRFIYIYILIFIARNLVPITLKFYAIAHLAL